MDYPICIVDAFTDVPFSGNQAAVCFVGKSSLSDAVLQKVASEMNLPITAFLVSKNNDYEKEKEFKLRSFTPTNEVPLCGHATLASAAAIFETAKNVNSSLTISTHSGDLFAYKGTNGFVNMDLPLNAPTKCHDTALYSLCSAVLGAKMAKSVDEVWLSKSAKLLLIKMKKEFSRDELESLKPNFDEMISNHNGSIYEGVIVTIYAGSKYPDYDFFSRCFFPWDGILEDHVTGSAHTVLAPFWSEITGKSVMFGRQCSKRGGDVKVGIKSNGKVNVGGQAAIVMKGSIYLPE